MEDGKKTHEPNQAKEQNPNYKVVKKPLPPRTSRCDGIVERLLTLEKDKALELSLPVKGFKNVASLRQALRTCAHKSNINTGLWQIGDKVYIFKP